MKRKLVSFLLFTLTVILTVCSGVGCQIGGKTTAKLESSTEKMIVMSIESSDGKANAFNALRSLQEQGVIDFEYQDSTYGAYVTSINGKAEQILSSTLTSSEGYSWKFYTSDREYAYDSPSVTFEGKVCGLSSLGASTLPVKEGEIYVWVYEYYHYTW